ncbi:hypothetical protein PHMEG_00032000 [Phytophthora megakarya]|uniref:Uncharacterized protein n=1 Tax=Phytophthora megakarya TaxID=4795 RepID=A0A225UXA8_9STRA|nr:hypothetical protein PHMEG_00032000 [Phytophthora megakarya]
MFALAMSDFMQSEEGLLVKIHKLTKVDSNEDAYPLLFMTCLLSQKRWEMYNTCICISELVSDDYVSITRIRPVHLSLIVIKVLGNTLVLVLDTF